MPRSPAEPTIEADFLKKVIKNIEYNKTIIEYYCRYSGELPEKEQKTIMDKVDRVYYCNKYWAIDKYERQKIKDVKRQNLCHDKFCANCKKVRQAGRMAKYIPELEKHQDNLYHLVLTVPNCAGEELKATYKNMARAFRELIMIIRGEKRNKIKGIDFTSWDYQGAIRSFEVTYQGDNYHPHFHVGLVLGADTITKKKYENIYSYDTRSGINKLVRLFSKEEILIQKIWYLLINKIKVTAQSIKDLKQGYSCTMDKFPPEDYAELFKYMTKEKDESGGIMSYENFKTLYESLYRLKQIQGYGCLYRIDDNIDLEEYEAKWNEYLDCIRKKESPVGVSETPQELILDNEYKLISRKSYFSFLREL